MTAIYEVGQMIDLITYLQDAIETEVAVTQSERMKNALVAIEECWDILGLQDEEATADENA